MNTQDMTSTEFEDAFNKAVIDSGYAGTSTQKEEQPKEELSNTHTNTDVLNDEYDATDGLREKEEEERQVDKSVQDSFTDYKSVYEGYKRNADSHIELMASRLNELSAKYQELKNSKEKQEQIDEVQDVLPDNVKDVFDTYPDIAEAITGFVNYKLGKTNAKISNEIESRVKPIQQQVAFSEAQRHEAIVRQSHPDLTDILANSDLQTWIQSLPPVMRMGAIQVYNAGNAEQVVALLNDFKQARGISSARYRSGKQSGAELSRTSKKQDASTSKNAGSANIDGDNEVNSYADANLGHSGGRGNTSDSYTDDKDDKVDFNDPIVKRVMAALAVQTNREPIDVRPSKPRKSAPSFDDVVRDFERNPRSMR